MRRFSLYLTILLAILFASPSLAVEPNASTLSQAQIDALVVRLAQLDGDPTTDCAACIADCGVRYGRICNLACAYPYSACSSMCAERRMECTQECRADLQSCRRRIRSCRVELGTP